MKLEPVIGLEIHVQLKTKSKMFCGCSNRGEFESPNVTVCPVCLGEPGALPVTNAEAVRFGTLIGLALGGRINPISRFDRKNYFYPDLPKGYQISQKDLPVMEGGRLELNVTDQQGRRRPLAVRITRVHLEEDAAKLLHAPDGRSSSVDFNRSGTPLAEIVTEPDLGSPADAKACLQELRLIMRYLGVSEADMEKGHLRCDANISLREVAEGAGEKWHAPLSPKTEVKNINSFRALEKALEFEIRRQTKLWNEGQPPAVPSTRGWDDVKEETVAQREKEEAHDYRYFPEPDLPPLELAALAEELRGHVPELPEARRQRFMEEYGFGAIDAYAFVEDRGLADFAEKVMSELRAWHDSMGAAKTGKKPAWEPEKAKLAKLAAGWLLTKLRGVLAEKKLGLSDAKVTPENFAELLTLIHEEKLSGQNALLILEEMVSTGADPSMVAEEKNLYQTNDAGELELVARNVVTSNPNAVADWRGGRANAVQFLVGQMMKVTRGKAPPQLARELIEKELKIL